MSAAVRSWLEVHSEEAIAASYARRYGVPDAAADELLAALASFSASACLAADQT